MASIGSLTANLRLESAAFIRDLGRAQQAVATNTAQMKRSMRGVEMAANNVSRQVSSLRRTFIGLGTAIAAVGVGVAVRDYSRMADTMSLLRSRLRLVTDSTEELARTQTRLFEISQQTRTGLEATSTLFQRVARSRKELGKSTEDILKFTQTIQQLTVTSGASAQEATAAVIQLSQGLASGQVRGEELRSVMEQLPAVAQAAAAGLNMTLGEFRDASLNGEVSARQFFDAIIKGSEQAAADFQRVERTAGQAFTQLQNEFLRAVDGSNQASEATKAFVEGIDAVRDAVGSAGFQEGLANIAKAAADVARNLDAVTEAVGVLISNMRTFAAVVAGLLAYRLAGYFASIAVAIGKYVLAVRSAVAVTGAFNAVIARNPIGLLATAVGLGVGALIEFSGTKDDATEAAKRHAKALKDETGQIGEQTKSLREAQKAALERTVQLSESRAAALKQLKELQDAGVVGDLGATETFSFDGTQISGLELMTRDLATAIAEEEKAAARAKVQLAALAKETEGAGKSAQAAVEWTEKQTKAFQSLEGSLLPAVKAQREYDESVKLLDAAMQAGQVTFMQYNLMLEQLQINLDEATNKTSELEKAQRKAAEAVSEAQRTNEQLRAETQAVMDGAKAWEEYKKSRDIADDVEGLRKDLKDAGVAADQINRLAEERKFLLQSQGQAIEKLEQEQALYNELQGAGERAFDRIGSAVTQMFVEGKSGALEWKNIMLGVLSELTQEFIKLAALNPLKNALFGTNNPTLGGGFFGGLFGGGYDTSMSSSLVQTGGSGVIGRSFVGPFADGGSFDVNSRFPSVMAGRDNRLVSFSARDGERVTVETPGQRRMKAGDGVGSNAPVTMNFFNPTRDMIPDIVEQVRALGIEVQQTKQSIPGTAVRAVADAQRRGRPAMRSSFG